MRPLGNIFSKSRCSIFPSLFSQSILETATPPTHSLGQEFCLQAFTCVVPLLGMGTHTPAPFPGPGWLVSSYLQAPTLGCLKNKTNKKPGGLQSSLTVAPLLPTSSLAPLHCISLSVSASKQSFSDLTEHCSMYNKNGYYSIIMEYKVPGSVWGLGQPSRSGFEPWPPYSMFLGF